MKGDLLSLSDVTLRHDGAGTHGWRLEVEAMHLAAGEVCLLSGDNMSGKSSLLRLLAGMTHGLHVTGDVRVMGRPVGDMGDVATVSVLLSSQDHMFPELAIDDNVALGVAPDELTADWRETVQSLLREAGIVGDNGLRAPLATLSSGGVAMVKFCRALVSARPLVLMDEVSSFLDAERARSVLRMAVDLADRGRTFLIVSHNARDRAFITENRAARSFHISRQLDRSILSERTGADA